MNVANGAGPPGLWRAAQNTEGRTYYFNTQTKATQWTKPMELMTPAERTLASNLYKEYTTDEGKKYWYNTETKQSSWEMPEAYKHALAQAAPASKPSLPAPQFVAGGVSSFSTQPQRDRDDYGERLGPERQAGYGQSEVGSARGPTFENQSADPNYSTFEEGEAAFINLLRRQKVQPEWAWEQTMRATIKDPQYRALKDPKDRKAAFEKYAVEVRLQEKDRAKERLVKLRADFGTMLKRHPEVKHYTRWKTARPIIEGETIFRSTNDDTERRQLFEEYIVELKKANIEREAANRESALDELVGILKGLNLEPYTRWAEAHEKIESDKNFKSDEKFRALSKSDILTAFENHIKSLERKFNDERQREKASKVRRERQSRDRFGGFLNELRAQGKIKAGEKWNRVYPELKDEPRYTDMLGQAGSTPLDLFWDMVEEEEHALRGVRNDVYDVLEDKRYEVTPQTSFEELLSVMATDRRTANIPYETLSLIFSRLHEKVVRRSEEDKHATERHQRRAIDALRSKIKHLSSPAVTTATTWETLRDQIAHLDEFKALESDDLRKQAFEKVLRRLREKEEDAERAAKRDRDRERRNGYNDRRGSRGHRSSRSPEMDIYEAERRKAMADRERQYSFKSGATGLSPPARSRDRDRGDRYRGDSRPRGDRRMGFYDGERTRREEERERLFARPKGERELDYGGDIVIRDGKDGGVKGEARRRRRGSEGSEGARGKRQKKEKERTKTPEIKAEEMGMRSGSEEGEMVEDE